MAVAENEVHSKGDRPYSKVKLGHQAELTCCEVAKSRQLKSQWIKLTKTDNITKVQASERILIEDTEKSGRFCGTLLFKHVHLNDTGMYHCYSNSNGLYKSPGTYLQVYSKCRRVWAVASEGSDGASDNNANQSDAHTTSVCPTQRDSVTCQLSVTNTLSHKSC